MQSQNITKFEKKKSISSSNKMIWGCGFEMQKGSLFSSSSFLSSIQFKPWEYHSNTPFVEVFGHMSEHAEAIPSQNYVVWKGKLYIKHNINPRGLLQCRVFSITEGLRKDPWFLKHYADLYLYLPIKKSIKGFTLTIIKFTQFPPEWPRPILISLLFWPRWSTILHTNYFISTKLSFRSWCA